MCIHVRQLKAVLKTAEILSRRTFVAEKSSWKFKTPKIMSVSCAGEGMEFEVPNRKFVTSSDLLIARKWFWCGSPFSYAGQFILFFTTFPRRFILAIGHWPCICLNCSTLIYVLRKLCLPKVHCDDWIWSREPTYCNMRWE